MNWQLIAESAILVLIFMHVLFLLALVLKDNSIVDIGWGVGFIIIATHGLIRSDQTLSQALVYGMVVLWGLRLATYIHGRNKGKGEDFRYAAWRKAWGSHVVVRSYFQVFMLQGLLMLIIASPLYSALSDAEASISWQFCLGVTLFGVGFYFESVGDAQMKAFKADASNRGQIMSKGLWSYTRHPNYFGEALLWWGIALASFNESVWYLSAIGPAVLTFLLLKVSGVAMLERKYDGDSRYADYVRTTNAFLPWWPRR